MTVCQACQGEVPEGRQVFGFMGGREVAYCRACFRDLYPEHAAALDRLRDSCPECVAAGAAWRDTRHDRHERAMATIRPRRRH